MKKLLLAVVAAALTVASINQAAADPITFYDTQAAFNAAASTSLLDDFSFPPGTGHVVVIVEQIGGHGTTSITRNGITYTDISGTNDILILAPGDYWNFKGGTTTNYVMTTDYDEHILATFSTWYKSVGFTAYFNGLGPGTVTVFGPGGNTIGTLSFDTGLDPATGLADVGYIGFTSSVPIAGFQWDTTGGGSWNTGFSNLSVGDPIPPVPLPASAILFASGLGLLSLLGWRRKKKLAA